MAGLGYRQPLAAAALTIFLLSLIGVPLTGGFFGKFYVFKAALDSHLVWLTVLGLLNSAVAAYYYLRLIVVMYMVEPSAETSALTTQPLGAGMSTAIWASVVGTLILGIFPGFVLDFAGRSAELPALGNHWRCCSGLVTPGGNSSIRMLRKWISAPSDSRQRYPFFWVELRMPLTTLPLTESLITPSTATTS